MKRNLLDFVGLQFNRKKRNGAQGTQRGFPWRYFADLVVLCGYIAIVRNMNSKTLKLKSKTLS